MKNARLVFISTSLIIVLLFTGLLMAGRQGQDDLFRSLGILAEVVHLVNMEYVDALDTKALELSLEAGIVQTIDPWAAVLSGDQVEQYQRMLESPPPFGLLLISRLSSPTVRHALPGSPAAEAGLGPMEMIESLDGVYTRGQPLWQIRLILLQRLAQQQPVHLSVLDRFGDQRREVTLQPDAWECKPLTVGQSDGIDLLTITSLPRGAAATLAAAMTPNEPLILDLRQLVWGVEAEAIAAADLFASEGTLALWRGQRAGEEELKATATVVSDKPPVVLIGPGTEGVGEILAAALRRAGATIVGHRSMGHAPHMSLVHDGDLHLWIPTARWLRADEQPIYRNGIEPDETVSFEEAAETGEDTDPVLQRAIELIRHGHQAAA